MKLTFLSGQSEQGMAVFSLRDFDVSSTYSQCYLPARLPLVYPMVQVRYHENLIDRTLSNGVFKLTMNSLHART